VKISALPEFFRFTNRVQEKRDGQGAQGEGHRQQEREKPEEQHKQASEQEVTQAVSLFQGDVQAREAGLFAETVGQGPGLRVVLRDGRGAVVRQFTGEEFLKLRETAAKDTRARGKILDQKF
jgi:hypothetical protein